MSKKKPATEKQAAIEQTPAVEATPAATRATERKGGKTKAKAPAKPKAPAKAKRTADSVMPKARASDELVVFAFRLTPEERDTIHDAAGPARASRFVRAVALAAARRDVAALQSILLETQREAAAG